MANKFIKIIRNGVEIEIPIYGFDTSTNGSLILGHKKEHDNKGFEFYGFDRVSDKSSLYFYLSYRNKTIAKIILYENILILSQKLTLISSRTGLKGQIVEHYLDENGNSLSRNCGDIFNVEVRGSLDDDGEEIVDDNLDLWGAKLEMLCNETTALITDIQNRFMLGEFTPKVDVSKTDNVTIISIIDHEGLHQSHVFDGYTPKKGVDYFTDEEVENMVYEASKKVIPYDDTEIKAEINALEEVRVVSLDETTLDSSNVIETVGIPVYVSRESIENYSQFGVSDYGWYIFSRIKAKGNSTIEEGFEIYGVDGLIEPEIGSDHVDVAIKFGVAAESKKVNINWGSYNESLIFRATDLAIRNLDQRVTYYVYNISDYAKWEYEFTTDTTVVEGKRYYILEDEEYKLAELTVGDEIPADTYYKHSKVTFEGFPRNISYQTDTVDCPVVIVPPVVEENGYGAWFEIQTTFDGSYSVTVTPKDDSKISTTFVQAPAKGINMLNLQYHMKEKCWMIANNKWAIS